MSPIFMSAIEILLAMQASFATITGTVQDSDTGEPLVGAEVALPELERATATDANGAYILRNVPPGTRTITVRFVGHAPRTLLAIVPPEGSLEIDVALVPEPVHLPPLEVRSSPIDRVIELARPGESPDRSLTIEEVRSDPQLAEPDAFQAFEGGEIVLRAESPNGVHIRGGASDQTAFLLDGIPIFSPYHSGGVFSAWNPDALESLQLTSAGSSAAYAGALSGTIAGATRSPGLQHHAQGSLSNSQARVTVDGPLGVAGAGFQLALRSGFPGVFPGPNEASYVGGEIGDALAKLEGPVLGGRARILGYENSNEFDAAVVPQVEGDPVPDPRRNVFEWDSRSFGGQWARAYSGTDVSFVGWNAQSDASADWTDESGARAMSSRRRDFGAVVAARLRAAHASTDAGIRVERSNTAYSVTSIPDSAGTPPTSWSLDSDTPVFTAFAEHSHMIAPRVEIQVGASLAASNGEFYPAPSADLRWTPSNQLTLSGGYSRTRQFVQSLSNSESVVRNLFPADLPVGAGAPGVPVSASDLFLVAAEVRPSQGSRLGMQAYARRFDDIVLVAPREGEPFATSTFAVGSGTSRGMSLEAGANVSHFAFVASYGLQHTEYQADDVSYAPDHGATHSLEGGITFAPTPSSSIRVAAAGTFGRHATVATGDFEWEAFNLADKGSEFGGSPSTDGSVLGGTDLPAYGRLDLGLRKSWAIGVGQRKAEIALFGTYTNVLSRQNVLTYARNPSTGELVAIEMRTRTPLVVGLDWRF